MQYILADLSDRGQGQQEGGGRHHWATVFPCLHSTLAVRPLAGFFLPPAHRYQHVFRVNIVDRPSTRSGQFLLGAQAVLIKVPFFATCLNGWFAEEPDEHSSRVPEGSPYAFGAILDISTFDKSAPPARKRCSCDP